MGKPTGFMEYKRQSEGYQSVETRLTNFQEFVAHLPDDAVKTQAARCMECGVPFCNNACPVNNLIPDWNDLIYRGEWREAFRRLMSTNNFPEVTSRICPSPCEAACTLGLISDAVGIRSVERAIIDKAASEGWIVPHPSEQKTGKTVAIVGSGPTGLACAQQLIRIGHDVTVFEKNNRIGGLMRYGIPDFKLDKALIEGRRVQLAAEGVKFVTQTLIGTVLPREVASDAQQVIAPEKLMAEFDAVVLAGGSETPRDLVISGRDLKGVHFALEFLIPQNRENAGDAKNPINAKAKHVVVIGGGDTGSDCVGTANRQGAASVTQFELLPRPPEQEDKSITWPYWPNKLRTSSSHDEGCMRDWSVATKAFVGKNGQLEWLQCVRLEWKNGKPIEISGSEFEIKADLVFLAMGFTNPVASVLEAFDVAKDARGNVAADTETYATNVSGVFAAGDMRRGQSLVVWAIREGRQCARAVDEFLMGNSLLPR